MLDLNALVNLTDDFNTNGDDVCPICLKELTVNEVVYIRKKKTASTRQWSSSLLARMCFISCVLRNGSHAACNVPCVGSIFAEYPIEY